MAQILIFGTSITYGAWDKEGGWVARLRKHIDNKLIDSNNTYHHLIYNLGVSGDNTLGFLERFNIETKLRIDDEKEETVIIFSVGTNDSQFVNANKQNRVPPQEFEKNLKKLVQLAGKYTDKILMTGIMPVDDEKMDPIPWAPEKSYKNEFIKQYDAIVKKVCSEEKVDFIEIFEHFMNEDYKTLLYDGVHPNAKGHKKIYEIVKKYLEGKEII